MDSTVNLKEIKNVWLRKVRGKKIQQDRERKGRLDRYFEVDERGVVTKGRFCRNEYKGLW